jgi:diaminopimelate epimerase
MTDLGFTKMHGLGNDFVVIDARGRAADAAFIGPDAARAIAERHTGVGCDQLIIVEDAPDSSADVFMRIRNADGSEVSACGNATRCIGALLMDETGRDSVRIRTAADLLHASRADGGLVTVDMGTPRFGWDEIPLLAEHDTLHLPLSLGPLRDPAAASMGNPHATFFVGDAELVPLSVLGPELERDPIFPERANIAVAEMRRPDRMRLRVWERGAGITLACGTGACAAVANAHRRGLSARKVTVTMDGGDLVIDWRDDGRIYMTGPAVTAFTGTISDSVLRAAAS